MNSQILISFCIPTFNRLIRVKELVYSLLSLPDSDIEVVVLDNGSSDGTYEQLSMIADPRLKLAKNEENKGALFNMVNVFKYANGEYVVYSTDQDKTNIEQIEGFKHFLSSNRKISCGFCEFDVPGKQHHEFFLSGYDAVNAIAYKGRHPTGYFFRNEHLKNIRLHERYADFNVVDLFPLEFAFAEIAMLGDGAIYDGGLFSQNNGDDVASHKSATTNGASKKAFFAPSTRLKLAVSYSRHVEQLSLTSKQKQMLKAQIFLAEFRAATKGYKQIMANERICTHYWTETRNVGFIEIVNVSISFSSEYFRSLYKWGEFGAFLLIGEIARQYLLKRLNKFKKIYKKLRA